MDKFDEFSKKDGEFFQTPIYGIFENVSSITLHATITKEHHESMLESLQKLFPDEEFGIYCLPLSDKLDIERVSRNLISKMETLEPVESD